MVDIELAFEDIEEHLLVVEHRETERVFDGGAQFIVVEQIVHEYCRIESRLAHSVGQLAIIYVLVAIVEAIVAAVCQLQEVAVLHIAKWFGPSDTTVHSVGPSVIFYELANIFVVGLFVVVFVKSARVVVFVHITVVITNLSTEAAALALLKLVVIHKLSAKFVA